MTDIARLQHLAVSGTPTTFTLSASEPLGYDRLRDWLWAWTRWHADMPIIIGEDTPRVLSLSWPLAEGYRLRCDVRPPCDRRHYEAALSIARPDGSVVPPWRPALRGVDALDAVEASTTSAMSPGWQRAVEKRGAPASIHDALWMIHTSIDRHFDGYPA